MLEPGAAQIGAMLLILVSSVGLIFSVQARFAERRAIDVPTRLALATAALVVLFHPDRQVAAFACIPVGRLSAYWILRRRDVPVAARAALR